MRLLLISNSTMPGEPYLDYPKLEIRKFLGEKPVKALFIPYAAVTFSFDVYVEPVKALFIPYAAVTFSFDLYVEKVQERFSEIGHSVIGIHTFSDPVTAVHQAEAIVVGGGHLATGTYDARQPPDGAHPRESDERYTLYRLECRSQCGLPHPAYHQRYAHHRP